MMRYNPFAKREKDVHGRVCFYIYNDDGTPAVGPSGHRFCYTQDKAEEIIKKVEARGGRVSPFPPPEAERRAEPGRKAASRAGASRKSKYKVGDILMGDRRGTMAWNLWHFYRVESVGPSSLTMVMLEDKTVREQISWADSWEVVPSDEVVGDPIKAMLNEEGDLKAYHIKLWDGTPQIRRPYLD